MKQIKAICKNSLYYVTSFESRHAKGDHMNEHIWNYYNAI